MKGFLGGVSIGALVAVMGAAMWSLSSPLPTRVEVDTTTPDGAEQPLVADSTAPVTDAPRDADLVEVLPTSPQSSGDTDTSPLAVLDTNPGSPPVVGTEAGTSEGDTSQVAGVETLPEVPSTVAGDQDSGTAPDVPGQEENLQVSTETAALPEPVEEPETQPAPEVETATDTTTAPEEQVVADGSDPASDTVQIEQTEPDSAEKDPSAVSVDLLAPQIGTPPQATALPSFATNTVTPVAPQGDGSPETVETESVPPQVAVLGENGTEASPDEASAAETSPDEPAATDTDSEPQDQDEQLAAVVPSTTGPSIGTPVVPLTERASAPSLIGGSSAGADAAAQSSGVTPFEANAQEFAGFDNRPLMSIVLIDDEDAIGAEALAEFPYPITFSIAPSDPKAMEKMKARRAAGFEVLILADLPREAAPQDAETTLAVWMEQMPLAVGFLEGVETGFQGNRPLADQMVAVMQAAGYGMVTQNNGLNTVQKLALRDGMPSGVVFRDFDGAGQNPRAMRRFLDQAAFRARQEGAVIMLGRLRPDTISALLLWGLQDRASQVGLAPISAALKANLTP